MPMAITTQAAANIGRACESCSRKRPAANSRLEAARTPLPPQASIVRPTFGPITAVRISEAEKMPKIQLVDRPRSRDMSSARTAGR